MTSGRSGESPDDFSLPGPNSARVYDYFLGGVNNFGVDRAFAKQVVGLVPEIAAATRLNRRFIHRAVRYLVEQGVSQFLEIGCGTPTFGMVHEVAQAIEPGARVVYVDSESVAVAHAELRLRQGVAGTGVLRADLCEPDEILGSDTVQQLVDLSRPTAILLGAVLHFIPDSPRLTDALRSYVRAMASGSALVISHATPDHDPERLGRAANLYQLTSPPLVIRSRDQIETLFSGTSLVEPGLVWTAAWRPEPDDVVDNPEMSGFYGGVGRKP
ncbi:MAG TPA: SAM-dependent methyltransferase [Pseudonocardiaceae bacterium]